MIAKITSLYSNTYAWVGTLGTFLLTFFGDTASYVGYIAVACFLDLICGLIRSFKTEHKGVVSSRLVNFVSKCAIYFLLFLSFVLIDKTITDAEQGSMWLTRSYTAIIIFSEVISMLANLSVSFPNFKAFALVNMLIKSEVADKLNIEKSEIDKVFSNKNNDNKNDKI